MCPCELGELKTVVAGLEGGDKEYETWRGVRDGRFERACRLAGRGVPVI